MEPITEHAHSHDSIVGQPIIMVINYCSQAKRKDRTSTTTIIITTTTVTADAEATAEISIDIPTSFIL